MTRSRSSGAPQLPSSPRPSSSARPARWPDLLTGALALAVAGGLAALWWGERAAPAAVEVPPAAAQAQIPAAPATLTPFTAPATPAQPATGAATGGVEAGAIPPAPPQPPVAEIPAPQLPDPVTPAQPGNGPAAGGTAELGSGPAADVAATQVPAAPATPAAAPRAGGAVATSETRTPLRSDYRVTLGTFGSQAVAETSAEPVEALGYTVYTIDLGDQYVAQIGPFADEAAGRAAQADIQRVYPRAELYPPRGRALGTSAPVPASGSAGLTTPAPSPAPESVPAVPEAASPAPTSAPAPSTPTYLQVGAFNSPEGAQRLVGLLRDQGFAPSVNAPEGGKTTVLVGPFSGEALLRAEQVLTAAGFESFRLR